MSTPEVQAVEREMAPKLAAHARPDLPEREALRAHRGGLRRRARRAGLTAEQQRLVWLDYTNFVRAGAKLDAAAKERLSAINQRLATLYTQFSQNVLADETDDFLVLEGEADLAGLPASLRDGRRGRRDQGAQPASG